MISLALVVLVALALPDGAAAAEVLHVGKGGRLEVGDRNRSYGIQLACIQLDAGHTAAADAWLRLQLPRRTRVNFRPMGDAGGVMLARVNRLEDNTDLSEGLVAAGLADPAPCP